MKINTLPFVLYIFFTHFCFSQTYMEVNSSYDSPNGYLSQAWEDNVVLTAEKITGEPAYVIYDNQFNDKGFGINGARWKQIDYYQDYQGNEVNTSEKIIINFNGSVDDLILTVGMMGLNEGVGSDDETGKWTAYNSNDIVIGSENIGPAESMLGVDIKYSGSYGKYPFEINASEPIAKLIVEATGFGYGLGAPKYVSSYNNESGNTENNSDFNVFSLSYNRTTLNVNDVSLANNSIKIYPNPFKDFIKISSNNSVDLDKIEIHDILGKRIIDFNYVDTLDLSILNSGVYIIKIYLNKGLTISKRLVKM